jgi:hypothetical protein
LASELDLIDASIRQVGEVGDIIVYNRRPAAIFMYSGSYILTDTNDILIRYCVNEHTSTCLRWSTLDAIYLRYNMIDYNVYDSVCLRFLVNSKKPIWIEYNENRTSLVIASAVICEVQVPYGAVNGLITRIWALYQFDKGDRNRRMNVYVQ